MNYLFNDSTYLMNQIIPNFVVLDLRIQRDLNLH